MSNCKAIRCNDEMQCECGLTWDVNDPEPPICRAEGAEKLPRFTCAPAGDSGGLYRLIDTTDVLPGALIPMEWRDVLLPLLNAEPDDMLQVSVDCVRRMYGYAEFFASQIPQGSVGQRKTARRDRDECERLLLSK